MMKQAQWLGSVLLASCSAFACSDAQSEQATLEPVGSVEQAVLGGKPAEGSVYSAVGALVYYLPEYGVLDAFCSGTLIGKRAVLTARHCAPQIDFAIEAGLIPAFALGQDAFAPTQVIALTSYVTAPAGPAGLLLDGGRDVAVAYLESKPAGIRPAQLGRFENDMLGEKFKIAGFGIYDTSGIYGQKFAGRVTAREIKGKWYKLIFDGDYEAYREWYFADSPFAVPSEEEALEWWNIYRLEKNYELLAGGLPGDSLSCFGDSGGPLLRGHDARTATVYGVNFAGEASIANQCTLGSGYLVFNREMLRFVRDAR